MWIPSELPAEPYDPVLFESKSFVNSLLLVPLRFIPSMGPLEVLSCFLGSECIRTQPV